MKVQLINITNNPIETIYKAYRICYSKCSYDEVKVPRLENGEPDIQKMSNFIIPLMLEDHHTPIEHVNITFSVEGVSRACLAQITRHRLATFNCVSGDTILFRGHNGGKKITIKELFEMSEQYRNMSVIRCLNMETKELETTKVLNVWKTGNKEVYEVTAKNGYKVKTTLDHRFLTPEGWKELKDLKIGDVVYTNGIEAYKDKEWLNKKYNIENLSQEEIGNLCGVSKHTIRSWVRKFGLQKELGSWSVGVEPPNKGRTKENYEPLQKVSEKMIGNNNGSCHGDFNNIEEVKDGEKLHRSRRVKKDIKCCEICGATDCRLEVHHIDKDHNNENEDNLLKLCTKCHKIQHGKGVMVVQQMEITSIEHIGIEEVYDIEVENEGHNFVGNGFILHNCQSQRYVDGNNFDFVLPDLDYIENEADRNVLEFVYHKNFEHQKDLYNLLISQGVKKEDARAILPQATTCNFVMTVDMNSFRNIIAQRTCVHAQKEIRQMVNEMVRLVKPYIPFIAQGCKLCEKGLCNKCQKK